MTSVPVMSDGIRSGVNWMRLNVMSSDWASVLTINVLARPGTPIKQGMRRGRRWPSAVDRGRLPGR